MYRSTTISPFPLLLMNAKASSLTVARSLGEARAALATTCPDLAIIDVLLPDGRGLDLLPGEASAAAYPTVMMTSHGNEQVAVEAIKTGAVDYVVKSEATLADMPHIAERALRAWGHITARKQLEAQLRQTQKMEAIGVRRRRYRNSQTQTNFMLPCGECWWLERSRV